MIALIGDEPEAAEAALLQAYPGSDPMRDVLSGRMSLRRFRVMVENLPPGNPLDLARNGQWTDDTALLWQIESRLRDLTTMFHNVHREYGSPALEVEYLPHSLTPEQEQQREAQEAYDALMQQQLEQL